ncbi:MAG: stage II sporulation protein M, partial [Actinomycetota bacterium]
MDVDQFIARHRPEWERLEALVGHGTRGLSHLQGAELDQVLQLYQRVSGHLSEVRTTWGDRGLESYLTSVVSQAHAAVYGAHPRTAAGFV